MGFRSLRVINEDHIAPASGFGTHAHRDMEIVTYVLSGALAHRDSLGNGSVIRPGDVQRMSAGTGIAHSEWNQSPGDPVHMLQIWILPDRSGLAPSYEQRPLLRGAPSGALRLIAARDGAVRVQQDAAVYAALLEAGQTVVHPIRPGRGVWVQVAVGSVTLDGTHLAAGDGAAVTDAPAVRLSTDGAA